MKSPTIINAFPGEAVEQARLCGDNASVPTLLCPAHNNWNLPYSIAYADAQERLKTGEQQQQCKSCGKWIWQSEFTDTSKMGMTELVFKHLMKQKH
jgi:hypothetical protein